MTSELEALRVKERWFNQLVEWLKVFHPEVHADYTKRVMAVNKMENVPTAVGPPPVVAVSARPEAIDQAFMQRKLG